MDNHPEYNRDAVKRWGRQVLTARNSGTFAELITLEIAQCDLTIEQIAQACSTSRDSVNKWKAGKNYPHVHNLWALASIIHTEVNVIGAYLLYTQKIVQEKKQRAAQAVKQ
jgi:transcriptional regulator with XRE-family HTH domain|tara:strand:- start:46 stop:378 length:333 start_codon:yes stop_codon:yes gene_type:complete